MSQQNQHQMEVAESSIKAMLRGIEFLQKLRDKSFDSINLIQACLDMFDEDLEVSFELIQIFSEAFRIKPNNPVIDPYREMRNGMIAYHSDYRKSSMFSKKQKSRMKKNILKEFRYVYDEVKLCGNARELVREDIIFDAADRLSWQAEHNYDKALSRPVTRQLKKDAGEEEPDDDQAEIRRENEEEEELDAF